MEAALLGSQSTWPLNLLKDCWALQLLSPCFIIWITNLEIIGWLFFLSSSICSAARNCFILQGFCNSLIIFYTNDILLFWCWFIFFLFFYPQVLKWHFLSCHHTHRLFSHYTACSEVMEGWEDRRLSLVTWGRASVRVCVCSHVHVPVYVCVHSWASVSVCIRACIWIYVERRRLFIFIVFNEGPMCRIHNNTINPQQQQHGYNLYGNASFMAAPSHTVDISDSGQHGCAAAS